MSDAIFPILPGLAPEIRMMPTFRTRTQSSVSGVEQRVALMASPLWDITLDYNVLRQGYGETELAQVMGFFLARQGSFDSFLLEHPDPNFSSVSAQSFGTGDGSTTQFQLVRSIGGYSEPVKNVNGAPAIYKSGVLQTVTTHYTISSTGLVTFTSPPAASAALTWTGSYYWRVRFADDKADYKRMMQGLWEQGQIKLVSVK